MMEKRQQEIRKMYAPRAPGLMPLLFASSTIAVLIFGWSAELENYITAESGLGYWLGITGGSMMLIMLLYSVRKRAKWMRNWGAVRYWFRMHMVLGVLGPVLIMFHCGFKFGSMNSNVALISMIIVALSGVIGRYIYGKIHFGLYGSKATMQQLRQDKAIVDDELSKLLAVNAEWYQQLEKFDDIAHIESEGLIKCFFRLLWLNLQTRRANIKAKRALKNACRDAVRRDSLDYRVIKNKFRTGNSFLTAHFVAVRKIAGFTFFERLFALWHVLHIPLFIMLIITATFHILAVHMF